MTVAVEFIARAFHPADELVERTVDRIAVVETALRAMAGHLRMDERSQEKLEQYGMTGTAALRRLLTGSSQGARDVVQMSAIVALTGRLVDLTAHEVASYPPVRENDAHGLLQAADRLAQIRAYLAAGDKQSIARMNTSDEPIETVSSYLSDIQTTIERMPMVFAGLNDLAAYEPYAIDFNRRKGLFKDDAFTNLDHVRFALKGTLAATLCYLIYNAVDWRGLSTSVATCMITALSTVGSSRQKQLLRVTRAAFGGFGLSMSYQIFLLPHMDGIGDFTILFAAVTAIAAWMITSSPRISYAGAQTGFAFYLTQLRVFRPQTSISVARDDVLGILFGLLVMWLTFDRIWVKDTGADLMDMFVMNLRRMANFDRDLDARDLRPAIDWIRRQRATVTTTFDQIRNLADSLIFEFGPGWRQKVEVRDHMRSWQPQLRTYFLLQIAFSHYRLQADQRSIEPQADQNVRTSERILSLLADWNDRTRDRERLEVKEQLDVEIRNLEPARRSFEGNSLRSQPARLSESMLSVALSLSEEMLRPESKVTD